MASGSRVWAGRGEALPGIAGTDVVPGQLGRVADASARCRVRGSVRRRVSPRVSRVEAVDPASGERVWTERRYESLAGFDLVFGAPESVSLGRR